MIVVAFLKGCYGFYATILTRYVEPPPLPEKPWTDGTT